MPRLILIPLSIILVLLVVAAILVALLLDEEKVLELASAALYEETGATLTVDGESRLSLFPTIGVSLADAALTMEGSAQPDLRARSLEIGVQLRPLFSGNVELNNHRLKPVGLNNGLKVRIRVD